MMDFLNYFPEGIAQGDAFINRTKERIDLKQRIQASKHTV